MRSLKLYRDSYLGKWTFTIWVYKTKWSMLRAIKRVEEYDEDVRGLCLTYPKQRICIIYLNERALGSGYVAHELFHATTRAMDGLYPEKQICSDQRRSEHAATLMAGLTSLFWDWWLDD